MNSLEKLNQNLKTYTCQLTPKLLEVSKTELNENPEIRDTDIRRLYQAAVKNFSPEILAKFENDLTDPKFLLRFLRVAKFKQDRAFEKLSGWIKCLNGGDWPELVERMKDRQRLVELVKKDKIFLLNLAISPDVVEQDGKQHRPWLVLNQNKKLEVDDLHNYFVDIAAVSIISVDYLFRVDEAATVTGMYNANVIMKNFTENLGGAGNGADSNSDSSSKDDKKKKGGSMIWYFFKTPSLLKKMINLWTKTLSIRTRGSLELNYQPSYVMKVVEKLVNSLVSKKIRDRKKKFGNNWLEENEGILDKNGIPEFYGGNLPDEEGLNWIDKWFDMQERKAERGHENENMEIS